MVWAWPQVGPLPWQLAIVSVFSSEAKILNTEQEVRQKCSVHGLASALNSKGSFSVAVHTPILTCIQPHPQIMTLNHNSVKILNVLACIQQGHLKKMSGGGGGGGGLSVPLPTHLQGHIACTVMVKAKMNHPLLESKF